MSAPNSAGSLYPSNINLHISSPPASAASTVSNTSINSSSTPTQTNFTSPTYETTTQVRVAPKVRLSENRAETNRFDRLADLYSILVALEHVETLLLRDVVSSREYGSACSKLIFQYKVWMDSNSSLITSIEDFVREYSIPCNAALLRLKSGLPATLAHGQSDTDSNKRNDTAELLTITELFITAMDALKLSMFAVDQLFPALKDILDGLSRLHSLPSDHEVYGKVRHWVTTLNSMKASDELNDDQARQLSFDLDQAYSSFKRFIS